jgi:hypothetical protein
MQLRKNRKLERTAVNAARALFEASGCVFQEVDQANDYGKDAYVDLGDGEKVSGHCIAVQIKGGEKYRRKNGYMIPIENHEGVWRESPLPVAGIVFDEKSSALYWCDIISFLDVHVGETIKSIPVSVDNRLDSATIESTFKPAFREAAKRRSVGQAVLNLVSVNSRQRAIALMDCFGSGRSDPKVFILLRHLLAIFNREEFRGAVWILSHATDHPDIFWTKDNWVPHEVEAEIRKAYRWSNVEIVRLLTDVSWEEWQRGGLGQCVYSLLVEDPEIKLKMERVAVGALRGGNEEVAWAAFYLTLCWARQKAREKYQQLMADEPAFANLELVGEVRMILAEYPFVSLF